MELENAARLLRYLGLISRIKEAKRSKENCKEAVVLLGKSSEDSWHNWLQSCGSAPSVCLVSCIPGVCSDSSLFFLSLTPEIVSTPSSPEEEDKSILNAAVLIDDSVPTTKVQIRLADGSRLIQRFNSTHRWAAPQPGVFSSCTVAHPQKTVKA